MAAFLIVLCIQRLARMSAPCLVFKTTEHTTGNSVLQSFVGILNSNTASNLIEKRAEP